MLEESYDGSIEFGMTRYLVPYLHGYKGWALFCDCDFLWLEDVDKLFGQRRISCVCTMTILLQK